MTERDIEAAWRDDVRVDELPLRRFAVARHDGPLADIESTRRPMYRHLISHELVGGPPALRFGADDGAGGVDVLVGTTEGFRGDDEVTVEVLPPGWYAVLDFEGPETQLPTARRFLRTWSRRQGYAVTGPLLQVHHMDTIDGDTEQQLQLPIDGATAGPGRRPPRPT